MDSPRVTLRRVTMAIAVVSFLMGVVRIPAASQNTSGTEILAKQAQDCEKIGNPGSDPLRIRVRRLTQSLGLARAESAPLCEDLKPFQGALTAPGDHNKLHFNRAKLAQKLDDIEFSSKPKIDTAYDVYADLFFADSWNPDEDFLIIHNKSLHLVGKKFAQMGYDAAEVVRVSDSFIGFPRVNGESPEEAIRNSYADEISLIQSQKLKSSMGFQSKGVLGWFESIFSGVLRNTSDWLIYIGSVGGGILIILGVAKYLRRRIQN